MDAPVRTLLSDADCILVIDEAQKLLQNKALGQRVHGIGPVRTKSVSGSGAPHLTCDVHVIEDVETSEQSFTVDLPGMGRCEVELQFRVIDKLRTLFKRPRYSSGINPRPWRHSGPIMGGDPIWNNAANQWGTILFAAASDSMLTVESNACAGQCLSCNHVLRVGSETEVSTTDYVSSMTVEWGSIPDPNSPGAWTDIGGAKIKHSDTVIAPLTIRGLGKIQGIGRAEVGMRLAKYGATTGLTTGYDLGPALRDLNQTDKIDKMSYIRVVSGYFADRGDSGAAVLDSTRKLVGMIVSGKPGVLDEAYYIEATPELSRGIETKTARKISAFSLSKLN
jgi:hypothetical protein